MAVLDPRIHHRNNSLPNVSSVSHFFSAYLSSSPQSTRIHLTIHNLGIGKQPKKEKEIKEKHTPFPKIPF
jgi:hypothetical protein